MPGNELNTDITNAQISQLNAGNYLLEITNTVTGCISVATFELPFVEIEPQLFMRANPQIACFANGSLALDSITILGEMDLTENYLIKLYANVYDPAQAALDSVINFSGTIPFANLMAGTYYVRAFHPSLNLLSNLVQLEVEDQSYPPLIEILDLQVQRSCDTNRLATGAIAIQAVERQGTYDTYTYRWFSGLFADSTSELPLETTAEINSLPTGFLHRGSN